MQDILIKADNLGVDWINFNLPFSCEIHFLRPRYDPSEFKNNDSFKVLLINSEPSPWCLSEDELREISAKFDLIIGKKEIQGVDNIAVMPFGGSFVKDTLPKELGLSNLLSMGAHGSLLPGHLFRIATSTRIVGLASDIYEVYKSKYFDDHLNKLNPQIYPFIASLKVYPFESKANIFKKTHNIAIENNSEYNYFTEKLIDCFRTFTIPIYWGCTNIEDHFDIRGMIIVKELEKIPEIIESITMKDYLDRMPYMIKNYELSKSYWDVLTNIANCIKSHSKLN
jgi:hypothetical protein